MKSIILPLCVALHQYSVMLFSVFEVVRVASQVIDAHDSL